MKQAHHHRGWLGAAAVLVAALVVTGVQGQDEGSCADYGLIDWIKSVGGTFAPQQELRFLEDGVTMGVFATEDIPDGTVLSAIPWEYIITEEDETPEQKQQRTFTKLGPEGMRLGCATVRKLAKALQDDTPATPYVEFLKNLPRGILPAFWSDEGKTLLQDMLGGIAKVSVPPYDLLRPIEFDWERECGGADELDDVTLQALELVVTRAADKKMVPGYDLYNHRNEANAVAQSFPNKQYTVSAVQKINKGEQIFVSYNQCPECGGRREDYGTPEILRDYGFVEDYPRRFSFVPDFFSFENHEDDDPSERLLKNRGLEIPAERYYRPYKRVQFNIDMDEDGVLDGEWRADYFWKRTDKEELGFDLHEQWNHQIKFYRQYLHGDHFDHLPAHELRTIKIYNEALLDVLGVAGNSLVPDEDEVPIPDLEGVEGDPLCTDDLCIDHYDEMHWRFPHLDYLDPTCDRDEIMKFLDYAVMEEIQTHYQFMTFFERHEPFHDVCMDLDDIVQICSQYRPQYHEPSTHLSARYLDEVKRIVFIGGGDSMLLHESLKYPHIEKVLGLELDQTVVRKSFKYFATQPHFDDDRVEWWFGDAVKSLLLLPKSYWQTFDLVLVDLSETVMSFSVTKELDIFSALTLLLKPDGVMVKNELYLDQMSTIFDRSMQIHYPSGIICSQAMAMGSNKHDFFRDEPKDHGVETLLLKPANETAPFTWMHDAFMNSAWDDGKCNSAGQEPIPEVQETSAGILFIVDAEKTASLDGMEGKLYDAVKQANLTPISTPGKTKSDEVSFVVMEEGYIVARTWKSENYVAFDIHMWSGFDQHVFLRDALTKAVNSQLVSSFRVIAGGMFGVPNWRKDAEGMGPQHAEMRDCTKPKEYTEEQEEGPLTTTIDEFMTMYFDTKVTAMVVCGFEKEKCIWKDILEKHGNVEKLHVFYTCPSLEGVTHEEALPGMHTCESEVFSFMLGIENLKLDVFILDGNVGFDMGSVMNSIWSLEANRRRFMREERSTMISMGTNLSPDQDVWQRNFVDRYRTNIDRDPLFRSEIILTTEKSKTEIGVCTHNDREIIPRMKAYEDAIKDKVGSAADVTIKKIVGGRFEFQENYDPPMYDFEEYDSAPARAQFAEQKPMGREAIFQYNLADKAGSVMPSVQGLQDALDIALAKINITDADITVYKKIGDGAVMTATFAAGHAVLVWDGRKHVDVNLFNLDDDMDTANEFNEAFTEANGENLTIGLRDDLPRGTGRVINFKEDLETPMPPQPWPEEDEDDDMHDDEDDEMDEEDIYMD